MPQYCTTPSLYLNTRVERLRFWEDSGTKNPEIWGLLMNGQQPTSPLCPVKMITHQGLIPLLHAKNLLHSKSVAVQSIHGSMTRVNNLLDSHRLYGKQPGGASVQRH